VIKYPKFKLIIGLTVIAVLVVNLHSIYRWHLNREYIKTQRGNMINMDTNNITVTKCPDYWTQTYVDGKIVCEENLLEEQIGEKPKKSIDLSALNKLTDQQKCWQLSQHDYPWLSLQNSCAILQK
jgi:hypothetical protein